MTLPAYSFFKRYNLELFVVLTVAGFNSPHSESLHAAGFNEAVSSKCQPKVGGAHEMLMVDG